MPDVQFDEILAVAGPDPLLHMSTGILDPAPGHIADGIAVHPIRKQLLDRDHSHPLHDVIFEPGDLDLPILTI